jgi:putative nucleotidyltransferase with HDIG domain
VLFVCLLLSGIIPLSISSTLLIRQNRAIVVGQEREHLVRSAQVLSRQLDALLRGMRQELVRVGDSLLLLPGPADPAARLKESWVVGFLGVFLRTHPGCLAVRVLNLEGVGPIAQSAPVDHQTLDELETAFEQSRSHRQTVFRLPRGSEAGDPLLVLAVPVRGGQQAPQLILQAANRLKLLDAVYGSGQGRDAAVLLVDSRGQLLWSDASHAELRDAALASRRLADAGANPVHFTGSLVFERGGERREAQMTVAAIEETGWKVVMVKPTTAAMAAVNRMIRNAALASLLLVLLALIFAAAVARWLGEPLNRLAATTREVAAGNFGQRLGPSGLSLEIAELAENFNRMSGHVERHVEQLREAAAQNRDLFIGSIRAFAAAIDAKDPYTRGHSERVAAASRAVARHLGFDEEFQQRVWLGALLHDVGKIGVEDRILRKGGLLTPEEYEQMKAHTVVGAEIMGRIDQLKEIIPAVRWHHEAWNGKGYPDGLRGEQIPLIARIVAVSDTFDAVTTSRPYQQAYTPEFALATITRLTGSRFDAKVVTAFLSAFNAGQVELAIQRVPLRGDEVPVSVELLA